MRARFLAAAVFFAVPALGLAAPAVASPNAQFLVQHTSYALDRPLETYFVFTAPSAPTPARVSIFAPTGYTLELPSTPGQELGEVVLVVEWLPGNESHVRRGALVVGRADAATDPRVEQCAPGPHDAVWEIQPSGMLLLVDATEGGERALGSYRLDLCLGSSSIFDESLGRVLAVVLGVKQVFRAPGVPGEYLWRALVAPPRPGDPTPDDAAAFELRTVVPLPYTLLLRARYDARRGTVLIRGRLTGAGRPRAGVNVFVARLPERTEGGAVAVVISAVGQGAARTTRSGTFAIRLRVRPGTQLVAIAWSPDRPCRAPPQAPAGCLAETTSPLALGPFIVRAPRPG